VALSPMWCRAPRTIPLTRHRSVARKYADRENRHIGCEIRNLEERPDMIGPMMKPSYTVELTRYLETYLRHCERGW
jgi:hypothetical protein